MWASTQWWGERFSRRFCTPARRSGCKANPMVFCHRRDMDLTWARGVTHRYLIAKTVKPKGKCQSSQITRNYRNKNFTRSLGFLGAWCRPSGGVIVEIFSKKRTTHWKPRDWYPLQASIVVTTGSLDFQQKPRLRNICLTYKPTLIPGNSINGYRKWWALQKVFGIPLPLYGTFGFPFFEFQGYTSIMVA